MSSPPPRRSSERPPPSPPRSSVTWKLTEGTLVWSQPLTWIFDQWLGASEGPFPTRLLSPASLPLMATSSPPPSLPTPPLSSHSKDWATPNVNDVSLAIVHGWPHLNGWLVPRPAPYNGLLSHSDLFSAFFPPPWGEGSLSLSLARWLS